MYQVLKNSYGVSLNKTHPGITLSRSRQIFTVDSIKMSVTPIESSLLSMFIQRSEYGISQKEILKEIWGDELNRSDTLRCHMSNLRKKLKTVGIEIKHERIGNKYKIWYPPENYDRGKSLPRSS